MNTVNHTKHVRTTAWHKKTLSSSHSLLSIHELANIYILPTQALHTRVSTKDIRNTGRSSTQTLLPHLSEVPEGDLLLDSSGRLGLSAVPGIADAGNVFDLAAGVADLFGPAGVGRVSCLLALGAHRDQSSGGFRATKSRSGDTGYSVSSRSTGCASSSVVMVADVY